MDTERLDLELLIDVRLTDDERNKFPYFVKLLDYLSTLIASCGTNFKVLKRFKRAQENVKYARIMYIQKVTLYQDVKNILLDLRSESLAHTLDSPSTTFMQHLKENVIKTEVQQILPCLQSEHLGAAAYAGNLLGLGDIQPPKQLATSETAFLYSLLREKVQDRSQELAQFCKTLEDIRGKHQIGKSSDTDFGRRFSVRLQAKYDDYENKRKTLLHLMTSYQKLLRDNYDLMIEKGQSMIKIGELCASYDLDMKEGLMLTVNTDILSLKLGLLHLNILKDLYPVEVLQAHTKLKRYYSEELMRAEGEKLLKTRSLSDYESAGPKFHALIREYEELKERIANRRWLLSKMEESSETTN